MYSITIAHNRKQVLNGTLIDWFCTLLFYCYMLLVHGGYQL